MAAEDENKPAGEAIRNMNEFCQGAGVRGRDGSRNLILDAQFLTNTKLKDKFGCTNMYTLDLLWIHGVLLGLIIPLGVLRRKVAAWPWQVLKMPLWLILCPLLRMKEIQVQDQGVCHNTYSELVVSCMRPLWLGSFQRRHILLHKQRLHQPKCESQVQSQCARG